MKIIILSLFIFSYQNSFAEKIDNMKLAKRLRYATKIQVDMNVDADDRCISEQVDLLLDQIKSFKSVTRKNLKAFIDNHFTGIVFSPTQKVGSLSGSLGKVTLLEEILTGNIIKKVHRQVLTERVAWDSRTYQGEENKNSFTIENGKIKFLVKSADNRFLQYDFLIFKNKMDLNGKIQETLSWADKFKYPFDEVSGLEVADETSKKELGSFDCGKGINWFDLGFEVSF
jgi:hypothetical protein